MSDYDNRQHRLMLEQINQFESKNVDLDHLVTGLDSLWCALEHANQNWKEQFRSEWAVLEEVYASMLDQGYDALPESHAKLVERAVRSLKVMIESVLSGKENSTDQVSDN